MDWFSRYVLSWELSNTLDASFCVSALEAALARGRRPEIFNSDQGSQFTSEAFTGVLTSAGIAISMDGVGRVFDNIMVERLWRTVKYEDVYLRDYQTPAEARLGLGRYFGYYNRLRRHRSLARRTPAAVYGVSGLPLGGELPVEPCRRPALVPAGGSDMIETGGGCSVAVAAAAVTPVALRAPSATAAAATAPIVTVPPYPRPETVQHMGTGSDHGQDARPQDFHEGFRSAGPVDNALSDPANDGGSRPVADPRGGPRPRRVCRTAGGLSLRCGGGVGKHRRTRLVLSLCGRCTVR